MDESLFDVFVKSPPVANINILETEGSFRKRELSSPADAPLKRTIIELEAAQPAGSSSSKAPAKLYPFKLDTFQQDAIDYIEKGESVLVAAHTSAGKTAVAEYAIAKSFRDKQRVIYTSPIKALSNQKYRDLQEEFHDVGLMTGDMTINPNATCLIMTTEILRSMLYRGSEVMREIQWVIYDEVHYMRDKERGVVWEESIILLPHKVNFVFLSATIPNAKEFVSWVSKIHRQPCRVVYTDYRPVPLQHFIFPAGAEGLFLVVDEKSKFREDNFLKAMSSLQPSAIDDKSSGGKKSKKSSSGQKEMLSDLSKIIRLIMDRELDPCIVFSFSKKDCESFALQTAKYDFNSDDEKQLVEQVFVNAMEALSEDDQTLPQVVTILPLLKRGIGIHHGGLLPILKEVIEILFQEGLIKCLFATETFSIGINMPAKTVVFTQTRKFDGKDFRWITSGEYIQMSGRAGRRGKDDRGIVIQMIDEKVEPDIVKGMIYGASDPLHSSYHVSYNMLLNMLRVEDADPENILRASFHQYEQEQEAPALLEQAEQLQVVANDTAIDIDENVLADYYSLRKLLTATSAELRGVVMTAEHSLPFLQTGRLARVTMVESDSSTQSSVWGVIVALRKTTSSSGGPAESVVDVLVEVSGEATEIMPMSLDRVLMLSAVRLNLPKDLTKDAAKRGVLRALAEVRRRFQEGAEDKIPLLDPVKDMGVKCEEVSELLSRETELAQRMKGSAVHGLVSDSAVLEAQLAKYEIKMKLLEESRVLRSHARDSQAVAMKDELRRMRRVLRRLNYVSEEGVLGSKGRFSCELNTGDELVLTDMVFDGTFNDMTVEQTVALLSTFIHKEGRHDNATKIRGDLQAPFRQLQTVARNVCKVCQEAKITMDEEDYLNTFNPGLIDVTFAWANGSKFVEICKMTDIFEGSIIRAIRRLEELLRQLASACGAIGNMELKSKFEEGAVKIRRGVVFAASLYL